MTTVTGISWPLARVALTVMVAVMVAPSRTCTPLNETSAGAVRLAPCAKPDPFSRTSCALARATTAGLIPISVGPGATVKQPVQMPRPSSGFVTRMSQASGVAVGVTDTVSSRVVGDT